MLLRIKNRRISLDSFAGPWHSAAERTDPPLAVKSSRIVERQTTAFTVIVAVYCLLFAISAGRGGGFANNPDLILKFVEALCNSLNRVKI